MSKSLRMAVAAIAMAFLAVLAFSSTAGAQESGGNQAYVGGEVQSRTVLVSSSSSDPAPEVLSESLAFTGSDAAAVALVGAVAVVVGGSLLVVRRRSVA